MALLLACLEAAVGHRTMAPRFEKPPPNQALSRRDPQNTYQGSRRRHSPRKTPVSGRLRRLVYAPRNISHLEEFNTAQASSGLGVCTRSGGVPAEQERRHEPCGSCFVGPHPKLSRQFPSQSRHFPGTVSFVTAVPESTGLLHMVPHSNPDASRSVRYGLHGTCKRSQPRQEG